MINFQKVHLRKIRTIPSKAVSLFAAHKFLAVVLILFLFLGGAGIGVRGYLISKIKISPNESNSFLSHSPAPSTLSLASDVPSDNSVLGTSTDSKSSNADEETTPIPSPLPDPTFAPTPTPTSTPVVTVTSSSSSSSSGSSNCSTSTGVPNSWYSDFYPAVPTDTKSISATTGSNVTITVKIRDCFVNIVSVTDKLTISLDSGDSSTRVNGNTLPYDIYAQNGQVSFTITSQNAGTDKFTIQDSTSSFNVTDTNNQSLSIVFSSPSYTPSPTPTPTAIPTPTPSPSDSPTPSPSST